MVPVKVPFENEIVDADQLEFKTVGGNVRQTMELEDGTILDLHHEVKAVFKVREKKKPDGSPIYICSGEAVIRVMVPVTTTTPETKGGE